MKQFVQSAAAAAILALSVFTARAQDQVVVEDHLSKVVEDHPNGQKEIIIRPKVNVDTKISIEIKKGQVTVNGKSLSDYDDDDVKVFVRPLPRINIARSNTFRGGTAYAPGDIIVNGFSTNDNRAMLGVGTEKNEDGNGVTIVNITDASAAEKAGLKKGDVILKIDNTTVNTPEELRKAIGDHKPDDKVTVTYKREKKEQKATATLAKSKMQTFRFDGPNYNQDFPSYNFDFDNSATGFQKDFLVRGFNRPRLGLRAEETEEGKGLKVLDITDESTAEKAGLKEGDIITSFDGTEVNNVEKLREVANTAIEKGSFKVNIIRDGKPQELTVKIPKKLKSTSL